MKKLLCLCAAFALFAAVGCDDKKTTASANSKGTSTVTVVTPPK